MSFSALRSDTRGGFSFPFFRFCYYKMYVLTVKMLQIEKKMQKSKKSLQKICIYQKIVVPLHRHLKKTPQQQRKTTL